MQQANGAPTRPGREDGDEDVEEGLSEAGLRTGQCIKRTTNGKCRGVRNLLKADVQLAPPVPAAAVGPPQPPAAAHRAIGQDPSASAARITVVD